MSQENSAVGGRARLKAAVAAGALLAAFVMWMAVRSDAPDGSGQGISPAAEHRDADSAKGALAATSEASRATATEPSLESLLLRVTSSRGLPVQRARLTITGDTLGVRLGQSDAYGNVEVSEVPVESLDLAVTAQGFKDHEARLTPPLPRQVEIVLHPLSTICGTVVMQDGTPVGAGVTVIVSESSASVDLAAFASGSLDDARVQRVSTDDLGAFCAHGLNAELTYTLLCGGNGFATARALTQVRPDTGHQELVVGRLFAVQVRFKEPSGEAARVHDYRRHELRWWTDIPSATVTTLGAASFLAGVPLARGADELQSPVLLFLGGGMEETLSPVQLAGNIAGYAPVRTTLKAYAVGEGLHESIVYLEPKATGWGSVRVRYSSADDVSPQAMGNSLPDGILTLSDEHGGILRAKVSSKDPEGVVLEDIPHGTYAAHLSGSHSVFRHPSTGDVQLYVDGGAPAELLVPVDDLGAVQLRVLNQQGIEYTGRVQLMVSSGWPNEGTPGHSRVMTTGGTIELKSAPYVLRGIPEGKYSIAVLWPRASSDAMPGVVHVEVVPQECGQFLWTY